MAKYALIKGSSGPLGEDDLDKLVDRLNGMAGKGWKLSAVIPANTHGWPTSLIIERDTAERRTSDDLVER